jgi:predicted component of type VI protein secretion system
MKNRKMKWLPLLLVMALLAGLVAGCSSAKEQEPAGNPPVQQEVKVVSVEEVAAKYFAENPESNRVIPEAALKERTRCQ